MHYAGALQSVHYRVMYTVRWVEYGVTSVSLRIMVYNRHPSEVPEGISDIKAWSVNSRAILINFKFTIFHDRSQVDIRMVITRFPIILLAPPYVSRV